MAGQKFTERYRFDRVGNVVADTRQMTDAYLHPDRNKYTKGDALFVPRPSSPARLAFKAPRLGRRAAARNAGARAMQAVHAAGGQS